MSTHDIQKEVKKYILVFLGLMVLTVVTVYASNLQIGLALGVAVALLIAIIKGSLVASFFMHLVSEKKIILVLLIFTVFFFLGLLFLPLLVSLDRIKL